MRTNLVGRSDVSAMTHTPASGPAAPVTTPAMSSVSIGIVSAARRRASVAPARKRAALAARPRPSLVRVDTLVVMLSSGKARPRSYSRVREMMRALERSNRGAKAMKREGSLAESDLPSLMQSLYEERWSGQLTLTSAGVGKTVTVQDG